MTLFLVLIKSDCFKIDFQSLIFRFLQVVPEIKCKNQSDVNGPKPGHPWTYTWPLMDLFLATYISKLAEAGVIELWSNMDFIVQQSILYLSH